MTSALATIPYWPQPVWDSAFVRVQAWDVLVALGALVGTMVAARAARPEGREVWELAPGLLLSGFAGAHLVHVFAYEPALLADPWSLLRIWSGVSSFGGFAGAALFLYWRFRRRPEAFRRLADPLALGFFSAFTIARIGCFLAHDHKGALTDFPLAVAFPSGARHDLGLYEALLCAALAVWVYWRRGRAALPEGRAMGEAVLAYALVRWGLDFLRATDLPGSDARYLGLTPAQLGAMALALWALSVVRRYRRPPRT